MKQGIHDGTFKSPHLKLVSPTPRVAEVLKMSGLDMVIECYRTYLRPWRHSSVICNKPDRFTPRSGLSFSTSSTRQSKSIYVPSSHEARYFSCAGVNASMLTSIAANFKRATSLSISSGTVYTLGLSDLAFCAMYIADNA